MAQNDLPSVDDFLPITRLNVHPEVQPTHRTTKAAFDEIFVPEQADDLQVRMTAQRFPEISYIEVLLSIEEGVGWFHSEISLLVLQRFKQFPLLTTVRFWPEMMFGLHEGYSFGYYFKHGGRELLVAIGEIRLRCIDPDEWQTGALGPEQSYLSRELRAIAYQRQCPQIFCFDLECFLMLQFRADTPEAINQDCEVDCWVFRQINEDTNVPYALYRLLVQGFRRAQGIHRHDVVLNNSRAAKTEFFSGTPLWELQDGTFTDTPFGFSRRCNILTGGMYWVNENGEPIPNGDNIHTWDSGPFWAITNGV